MINVGIIGSGFSGLAHIEALRRLGFVQVVALCDGTFAEAQAKARQLRTCRTPSTAWRRCLYIRFTRGAQPHAKDICTRRLTARSPARGKARILREAAVHDPGRSA